MTHSFGSDARIPLHTHSAYKRSYIDLSPFAPRCNELGSPLIGRKPDGAPSTTAIPGANPCCHRSERRATRGVIRCPEKADAVRSPDSRTDGVGKVPQHRQHSQRRFRATGEGDGARSRPRTPQAVRAPMPGWAAGRLDAHRLPDLAGQPSDSEGTRRCGPAQRGSGRCTGTAGPRGRGWAGGGGGGPRPAGPLRRAPPRSAGPARLPGAPPRGHTPGDQRTALTGFPDAHADPRGAQRGGCCSAAGRRAPLHFSPGSRERRAVRGQSAGGAGRGGARRRAHRSDQSARSKWPSGGGARIGGGARAPQLCGRRPDSARRDWQALRPGSWCGPLGLPRLGRHRRVSARGFRMQPR